MDINNINNNSPRTTYTHLEWSYPPCHLKLPTRPGEDLTDVLYNTVGDFFVPKMCATREQIAIRKLLQLPTLKIDTFHLRKENRPRS